METIKEIIKAGHACAINGKRARLKEIEFENMKEVGVGLPVVINGKGRKITKVAKQFIDSDIFNVKT